MEGLGCWELRVGSGPAWLQQEGWGERPGRGSCLPRGSWPASRCRSTLASSHCCLCFMVRPGLQEGLQEDVLQGPALAAPPPGAPPSTSLAPYGRAPLGEAPLGP